MRAYQEMLDTANMLGLPRHYQTDLTQHDLDYLRTRQPKIFGWVIYDRGTHLVDPTYTFQCDNGDELAPRFWRRVFKTMFTGERHCFVWTGDELMEMDNADAMCDWLESSH